MVNHHDLAVFFRSLSVMFDAGLSLQQGLALLSQQLESRPLQQAAESMNRSIKSGLSFSQAVSRFPDLFPDLHTNMVRVAEISGGLPMVLARLADHEEKAYRTSIRARSALVYPMWILLVSLVFVVLVPPWLFRELFGLLARAEVELPLITRAMMSLSQVMASVDFYLVLGSGTFLLAHAVRHSWQKPALRLDWTRRAMSVWGLGPALRSLATARFARALEVMTAVGIPMQQAFALAGQASANPVCEEKAHQAVEGLLAGLPPSEALLETRFFPMLFIHAVKVGSESGELPRMLAKAADLYDEDLSYRANILLAALEPLTMLAMGLMVGVTIIATMTPMLRLIQSL